MLLKSKDCFLPTAVCTLPDGRVSAFCWERGRARPHPRVATPSLTVEFPPITAAYCLLPSAFCLLPTDSLRAAPTADRPAHFPRHLLGAGKDTEKILAQDLADILFAVAALQ